LKRGAGDEQELNDRIGDMNNLIQEDPKAVGTWMCTLMLLDSQIDAMQERWKLLFAPKTYLMVYRPGKSITEFDVQFWRDYGTDVFLWSSNDKVYSHFDKNGLGHRYRIAPKSEVDQNTPVVIPVTPPETGGDTTGDTTSVFVMPTRYNIMGKFNIFTGKFTGTIESEE
jgi:hypothetical protein